MVDVNVLIRHDVDAVVAFLPHLAVAAIVLLVAVLGAWFTGLIAAFLLARIGLDALGERTGVTEDLAAVGVRISPARIVGRLIVFIVILTGLVQACDVLELRPLADSLRALLGYMPHLVLAALVVLVGISVADTLAHNASGALSRAGILYHGTARALIRGTVVVLALLIALQQLTIRSEFLLDVLLVVLGGISLAFGLAGAWGARAFFENLVAGHYVERHLRVGDAVRFEKVVGTVEICEATSVTIRSETGVRTIVPNAAIARTALERDRSATSM